MKIIILIFMVQWVYGQGETYNPYLSPIVTSYASLYEDDADEDVSMASSAVWYQIDSIAVFSATRFDTTAARLIVRDAGMFLIGFSISFTGNANTAFHIAMHKNSTKIEKLSIERAIGTALDIGNAGATNNHRLALNDTLDLRVNANGNSKTFNYSHVSISVIKVGR